MQSLAENKEAIYNLFAAYPHTVPLEELLESVERARRHDKGCDLKLRARGRAFRIVRNTIVRAILEGCGAKKSVD